MRPNEKQHSAFWHYLDQHDLDWFDLSAAFLCTAAFLIYVGGDLKAGDEYRYFIYGPAGFVFGLLTSFLLRCGLTFVAEDPQRQDEAPKWENAIEVIYANALVSAASADGTVSEKESDALLAVGLRLFKNVDQGDGLAFKEALRVAGSQPPSPEVVGASFVGLDIDIVPLVQIDLCKILFADGEASKAEWGLAATLSSRGTVR